MYSMRIKVVVLLILTLVAGQFMLGCTDTTSTSSTGEGDSQVYPQTQSSHPDTDTTSNSLTSGSDSQACRPAQSSPPDADTTWNSSVSKRRKPDLEVSNVHSEMEEFGLWYVCGTVTNNTDRTYAYLQIEVNLYNDFDEQVGSTFDNVNNLEPGGTWKFRALVMEEKATKYKVVNVSGW